MKKKTLLQNIFDSKNYLTPIQYNLVKLLYEHGALPRRQLVKMLKTARTTIYDNLLKLKKKNMVIDYKKHDGSRGRPLVLWE